MSQGIERLKNTTPTWEKKLGWEGMKAAFDGNFSLSWFNPFSGLQCKKMDQGVNTNDFEMIKEDVTEALTEQQY
ncbi:hypothetical protein scyTo_0003618 [Scyliorhinus torazame]|uniref:Uncharacterized protein n=1 Tax=Scyliorhinus torazame TaxID=75743 RepID=A0A401PN22_SCYTO|nr:hypothetical protein [Scyliorhinus torazame]